jgi:hypothetical protein
MHVPCKNRMVSFSRARDWAAASWGLPRVKARAIVGSGGPPPSVSLRRKQPQPIWSISAPATPLIRGIQRRLDMGTLGPRAALAAMQYNELLARRIVVEVARSSVDGALQPVMLHEVARRLKIDEASAEAAMYRAVAERWLIVEGSSLYRIRLTAAGQALLPPR